MRAIRLLTSLAVCGLAAATLFEGIRTVRIALAEMPPDPVKAATAIAPFAGDPLLGDVARRDMLRLRPPIAAADAAASVGDLLSGTPLNSGAWVELAEARRAEGAPIEAVASALALSTVTGPNEEYPMARRAAFGLPFFRALPPDERRALVADLAGGWNAMDVRDQNRVLDWLVEAPDGLGGEVREALVRARRGGAAIPGALLPPAASDPQQ